VTQIIKMETNEIEIPKEMLTRVSYRAKSIKVYALSRHTIGMSFLPVEEWSKEALWKGEAKIKETASSVLVLLPQTISSFYSITPDNVTISVSPRTNTIQVDVQ